MKISQHEARRLRKRVYELERNEDRRGSAWCYEWPEGVNIGNIQITHDSYLAGAIKTSRLLKHAVVCSINDHGLINFHSLPLARKL